MKNLFKKMMLVAVAAMAFTACSQDVNEVNNVEKVTRYEFTANIADDTRSGFAEETSTNENGKVYHSEWSGDETLFLVPDVGESTTASISAEGKFSVELSSNASQVYIYSPASSWSDYGSYCMANVPAEQTSGVNSVDPKAHIVSGYAKVDANGNQTIPVTLSHAVAYGKMTVNDVVFAIDHVVVDLKDSYYNSNRELSYTIKANGVNNTFWFATEPIDVAEFTVTAYDAEGNAVAKTVNVAGAGKTMSFQYGRVGTFSVSGLKEAAEPEEPKALVFNRAEVTANSGDAYAYFYTANGDKLQLNPYFVFVDNTWPIGTHVISANYGCVYPGLGQGYSVFNDVDIEGGEIVVSVKNNKYYIEFNNFVDGNGNILIKEAIFEGEISGLQVPDTRTPLATPSVTATAEGNIITLSWDAVTGAESYYVFCASSSSISPITTTETTVTIKAAYSTAYEFMVTAQAADADPDFKSSEAKTIKVSTEKDPNVFADYVLEYVTVNSNYFEFNRDWHNGQASTKISLRIYMHADDKGSNFINPGQYTCLGQGATTPSSAGKVNFRYCTDTWAYYYSTANTSATLDVSIENGEYVIIATIDGKAWGYKGLPNGWIIPEGGDSGDEGGSGNEGGSGEGDSTDPEQPLDSVTINSVDFSNPKSPSFNDGLLTFEMYYTGWSMDGTYNLTTNTENSYINRSIYNVKVNGQPATTVSGAVKVTYGNDYYVVYTFDNVVINGITFTGSAKKYY
ncbi:MAG: hypothetical protein IKW47_05685 [Alistipes sp.]|nr:hypothetical protein [Alistipes sp.]